MRRPAAAEGSGCPGAIRPKHLAAELASGQRACSSPRVKRLLIKGAQQPRMELLHRLLFRNRLGGIPQSCRSQFDAPQLLSAGTDRSGPRHPREGLVILQYVTDQLLFPGF